MDKKQSILRKLDNPIVFFAAALVIISIIFVLFTPRIASSIFPFKRDMVFNNFLSNTKQMNSIDPQGFWEFREFYSPGYFDFSEKGIDENQLNEALRNLGVTPQKVDIYFSRFNAKNLISLDALTQASSLEDVFDKNNVNAQDILFENNNSIIFKNAKNQTFVVFLLPVSEMKKANGFFEYEGRDKNITQGKNWFNITKLD